jgi:hypothetical protein
MKIFARCGSKNGGLKSLAESEEKLSVRKRLAEILCAVSGGWNMKSPLMKLIPVGLLLLISAVSLSAQNTLPDPHNNSCWSSIGALQNCQIQAYNEAQDHAQRCTSYPEYQCIPEYVSLQKQPSTKGADSRTAQKPVSTPSSSATSPAVAWDGTVQQSN